MTDPILTFLGTTGAAFAYLVGVGVAGYVGSEKRGGGINWLLVALLATPPVALLALVALPQRVKFTPPPPNPPPAS